MKTPYGYWLVANPTDPVIGEPRHVARVTYNVYPNSAAMIGFQAPIAPFKSRRAAAAFFKRYAPEGWTLAPLDPTV